MTPDRSSSSGRVTATTMSRGSKVPTRAMIDDAREDGLGIGAGGEGDERIHPAECEEDDREINRSPVPGRESGHTH